MRSLSPTINSSAGSEKSTPCSKRANLCPFPRLSGCVAFERRGEGERIMTVANRNEHPIVYVLPEEGWSSLTEERIGGRELYLGAESTAILIFR